ncbi:hypothetical protein QP164_09055 [Sphingomonas sp. LR59]
MTTAADMLATGFATLPDLIRAHALERGIVPPSPAHRAASTIGRWTR